MLAFAIALAIASTSPAPAATPARAPADGTYSYSIRQGSTEIGTAIIAVRRGASAIDVHEVATLGGATFTVDQSLDPATLVPQTIDGIYPGAKPAKIHIAFASGVDTETIAGSPGSKTLTPPAGTSGGIVLDGPVMSGFFLAVAQAHAIGSTSLNAVSPGSAATFAVKLDTAGSSRPSGIPSTDVGTTFTGLPSGAVTGWYDAATFTAADFDIPSQGVSVVLVKQTQVPSMSATPAPAATPLPTAPPRFTSRDVTFRSRDGTVLAGTITIPNRRAAKAPALLLVHGSGPIDRDERIGPNPIFLELSNALSSHDYVVLRYDKRGVGKSGGDAATFTRDQLLADARAAIAFLATQPEVNAKKIFVVGHSEGGELAPSLAASGAPLRGIALMAPPAIPLDRILVQQATRGLSGDAARKARADQEHANLAILTGASTARGAAWLRSSFGIDPARVIRHVPCPILILQGGKDIQVLPADLPRLVAAARAAHRDVTVRIFPNDDHLFITLPGNQPSTGAEYLAPHRLDPKMVNALLAWLDARTIDAIAASGDRRTDRPLNRSASERAASNRRRSRLSLAAGAGSRA